MLVVAKEHEDGRKLVRASLNGRWCSRWVYPSVLHEVRRLRDTEGDKAAFLHLKRQG